MVRRCVYDRGCSCHHVLYYGACLQRLINTGLLGEGLMVLTVGLGDISIKYCIVFMNIHIIIHFNIVSVVM